jgi:hypothetical protein
MRTGRFSIRCTFNQTSADPKAKRALPERGITHPDNINQGGSVCLIPETA